MTKVEVKQYHDCETPSMIVGTGERELYRTFWQVITFRKSKYKTSPKYFDGDARWECPVCGSKWKYHHYFRSEYTEGLWSAEERVWSWQNIDVDS